MYLAIIVVVVIIIILASYILKKLVSHLIKINRNNITDYYIGSLISNVH